MGSNVYGALSAADDFGQQRVSRKWFGDHGICLYHRISQPVGWPLNTITGTCAVAGAALSSASTDRPDRSDAPMVCQGAKMGLLQSQQLAEQDGFVTTWAMASQTEGTAKEATVLATALTERTFAARRTLVEGVCDQRPPALEVSTDLAKVHVGQSLLAEPERTLFARRATVLGTSAGEWSIAYGAAAGNVGGRRTVTRTVTSGPRSR